MAITRVKQSQISGSLSITDTLEAGAGLANKSSLLGDLDSLRSQVNRIVGGSNWYSALSGSTSLAHIYNAVRVSGSDVTVQGILQSGGAASFQGAVTAQQTLSVGGNSTLASADIGGGFGSTGVTISSAGGIQANGALEVGGASMLSGSLNVLGASQFAAVNASGAVVLASTLSAGASTLSSLTVSGASSLAAVGASGAASFASTVDVIGASTFANASNSFNALSVSGSSGLAVAGPSSLAAVTASGMGTFNGGISVESGRLAISDGGAGVTMNGTLGVSGASSFAAVGASGAVVLASTLSAGASTLSSLTVSGASSLAAVGASGAATFASTVGVTGALTAASPSNVMNGLSVTGSLGLSVSSNLSVLGNATVNGDLYVKGATTYIQTDNMIVKDAFIYLATGSAGTTDSGIVFSKGAGASWDLIMGQDNGGGEFIFSKQSVNASLDSPADLSGTALVPAWMSIAKIGSVQGTLVGSLSKSGSDLLVKAESGSSLKFTALGDEAFDLAIDGEQISFDALFPSTSIIGAIISAKNSITAAALSQKGTLTSANVAANVLTFSSIGTLSSAAQKYIDVFLNGVLLSPVFDVVSVTTTTATLNADIGGSLVVDDVITVCLRSTTA